MRYSFLALYGDADGWKFIEALDQNIHHYTRSGNAPTDLVGRGEFMLGLTSDENVKKRLDDGYPLLFKHHLRLLQVGASPGRQIKRGSRLSRLPL